jgi:hypothetical protein
MTRLTLGTLALLGLFGASCSSPAYENNHWHINSVPSRFSYHFFGYRQSNDGPYLQKASGDLDDMGRTARRHLIHANPENPLLPQPAPKPYRPTPPDVEFQVGK